ncbi:MAG TPA: hypothetical protein PKL69_09125 [Agitococcus sp.]|nr:hypothetical protein [Agitococcus sp.]HNC02539.1 hypothetical protein [Agitococcus sp.]HNL80484.1 hypothetical protein [Agitococcus sp.]
MIDNKQLRELIIKPSLDLLQMYSAEAEELLVFTCACESLGGTYLKQIKGPALGIYQMEPATYTDIWQNYIKNHGMVVNLLTLNFACHNMPLPERMIYDLRFATAMARLHYRRRKEPLPKATDIDGIWEYYKKFYNTHLGKAEKESSIKHYQKYIKS